MNLMKKMMLRLTLLVLIPVLLIGFGAYLQASKALEESAQREAMEMTKLNAKIILDKIDATKSLIKTAGKGADLELVLTEDSTQARLDAKNYLHTIQNENTDLIEMMILVDPKGNTLVSNTSTDMDINISDRQYFIDTLASQVSVVSDVIVNRSTGNEIITVTEPIKVGGRVQGVLVSTILFDNIKEIVSAMHIGQDGYGYLINQNDVLIAHPTYALADEKSLRSDTNEELNAILDNMKAGETSHGFYTFEGVYKYVSYTPVNSWSLVATANYDDYMAAALDIRNKSLMISVGALIIAMISAYLMTRFGLVQPMKQLVDAMLKAGEGDLTVRTDIRTKDEIHTVGETFNKMMEMQGTIISEIREASGTMSDTAEELSASAQEVSATTEEITAKIDHISGDAFEQTQAIENANQAFTKLVASIEHTDVLTKESSAHSESALSIAEEGRSLIKGTVASINHISGSTDETVSLLTDLNKTAEKVSGISSTINGIADSINLLALNASIEAARAGEHGRGFSVVAEEVRKLAEQTSNESGEIQSLLNDILGQVRHASVSIQSTKSSVDQGVEQVSQVDGVFTEIIASVESIVERIATIKDSAHTESIIANEMSQIVFKVAEMAQATSYNTQDISAGAEEQAAITETLSASAEESSAMAESLNELVRNFKIHTQQNNVTEFRSPKSSGPLEVAFEKDRTFIG